MKHNASIIQVGGGDTTNVLHKEDNQNFGCSCIT